MVFRAAFFGRVLCAALLSISSSFVAPAVAAERISMRIEVYGLMGLHVLRLRTELEEIGDRYSVSVNYATTGVAGLIVNQQTYAVARGRLTQGSAQPESFRSHTRRNNAERQSQVDYHPDGTVAGSSTPALPNPLTPEAVLGTVDNLTAYLRLERQLAATRTCKLTVPVFDGRHRYDLVFEDAGEQPLARESGQNFEGVAIACRMTRHDRGIADSERGEGARRGMLWYAALVPGAALIPIRMRLETQIGTVDAYLAELRGRGVVLRLIE